MIRSNGRRTRRDGRGTELALTGGAGSLTFPSQPEPALSPLTSTHSVSNGGSLPFVKRKAHARALIPDDLDRVVELHRKGFGKRQAPEELRAFLRNIFFGHPWLDDSLPSLGYVDGDGELIGCMGVMPRPMLLDGRPIRAAVTHNFLVTPEKRQGLAAIQLMRTLSAAGPDLTLADGNEPARRLSDALGGKTLGPRSKRWIRVLAPAGLAFHMMHGGKVPPALNRALAGLAAPTDALARFLPGSPVSTRVVEGIDDTPDVPTLLDLMERHTRHLSLRPAYTEESLTWLLETLRATRQNQELRVGTVTSAGEAVGWYVYYSRPGEVGRVLQLGAAPGDQSVVLDHLFADAVRRRNVGLSGQTDPAWTLAFDDASCLIRPGRTWLLMDTSQRPIERAFATSNAFLTRLEGEAWLHYGY
jgi:hypothetical protein